MVNLTQDYGGIPVVWLRFNPNSYKDNFGKKYRANITRRIPLVIDCLKKIEIHKPKILCSTLYLFYDGFCDKKIEIEELNLKMLGL